MVRKLKVRISRVIPSFLACHSNGSPWMPESPLHSMPPSSKLCRSPENPKTIDIAFPTFTKSLRGPRFIDDTIPLVEEESGFRWGTEEKWHVVSRVNDQMVRRKISISPDADERDLCPPTSPASPITSGFITRITGSQSRNRGRKRTSSRSQRPSDSSTDSGWFSSEEEDETETLFSSRSFSSDSSDFFRNRRRYVELRRKNAHGFRRVPPGGKVREGFPVVKESMDPYGDFMGSMMEMIAAKDIFDAVDLEQLLNRFLSLNDPHHHGVILRVFSDVLNALFPDNAVTVTGSR